MSIEQVQGSLFARLQAEICSKLDPHAENRIDPRAYRLKEIRSFLSVLQSSDRKVGDLNSAVGEIRSVAAGPGTASGWLAVPEFERCLGELSDDQKARLQEYLNSLVGKVETEFPELVEEFPGQFPNRRVA